MNKTKRIKAAGLKSAAEFQTTINQIAALTVELRTREAQRDLQLQAVRDAHADGITEAADALNGLLLAAEKYADENREAVLPGKLKSADTALATYGFRLGQPTLKLLNRQHTWESVMLACKAHDMACLVRKVEEPDKDGIKRLDPEWIAKLGCKVDQSETFFVEPKDAAEVAA